MAVNLIVGNDGANALPGTAGNDLIYGFNPDGPQGHVTAISATRVATGLTQPLFAVAPPGDTARLFILEKTGLIRILDLTTGQILPSPFLELTTQINTNGEQGLLGLAFHPDFADNGLFYVHLTNPNGDAEIRGYEVSPNNPNLADPETTTSILTIDLPSNASNHRAGWLAFGPDGYLYVANGDGGSTPQTGQSINDLLGNILRIDVNADAFPGDATRNYAIPADNPFVGVAGEDEIFAFGLRNPWRPSFDRGLETLFIADVGGSQWEEVNLGQAGANYGWPLFEGPDQIMGGSPTGDTATAPIFFYSHNGGGRSITGGYVYRGPSEGLQGQYFFADFVVGEVFTLRFDGRSWVATERTDQITPDVGSINLPSSFGEDAFGNLYLVDFDGEVFRLTPNIASADQGDMIDGLSGNDALYGGSGSDTINAGDGNDTVQGGADQDQVAGDAGDDQILLGDGFDFAVGGTGHDTIQGQGGFDQLNGNEASDLLKGGADSDQLAGQSGNDTLDAGPGANFLSGGAGADLFILTKGGTNASSLADFQAGVDKLQLVGFGAGATLTANGNGTWTVKLAGGQFETFIAGAINPGDVTFVA
jgi:glucose/arabinose dehydrogenase